jgi:hypothetical protein
MKSDPIRYLGSLYEESARLGIHPSSESIWSLPVTLFRWDKRFLGFFWTHSRSHRFAAPFIVALLSDIFGVYLRLHAETSTGDKKDATPVPRLAEKPVVDEKPVKVPHVPSDMQTPVKDDPGNDTSNAAPSRLSLSLTDLKGRTKTIQTAMHDETSRFLRKVQTEVGASLPAMPSMSRYGGRPWCCWQSHEYAKKATGMYATY